MADINEVTLQALQDNVAAIWTKAFVAPPQMQLLALATEYVSTKRSNFYAFLEALGGFSEWNGARQYKDLASHVAELVNKDFESSIKMPRNSFEDDDSGMYLDIIPGMATSWFKKQMGLIMKVLITNPKAYDGTALFSTSRKYGDSTIANLVTTALSATTFDAAYVAMMSYTDHEGEPLAVHPDVLVVGPKLAKTAADILGNKFIGDGETSAVQIQNYYSTLGVRLVVSPYLIGTYENYWYLSDTTDIVKGVVLQIRKVPVPEMSNQIEISRTKTIDFLMDGRMNAGPGAPHKIYAGLKTSG
jgi:phage major head subunit gpT-like protein